MYILEEYPLRQCTQIHTLLQSQLLLSEAKFFLRHPIHSSIKIWRLPLLLMSELYLVIWLSSCLVQDMIQYKKRLCSRRGDCHCEDEDQLLLSADLESD